MCAFLTWEYAHMMYMKDGPGHKHRGTTMHIGLVVFAYLVLLVTCPLYVLSPTLWLLLCDLKCISISLWVQAVVSLGPQVQQFAPINCDVVTTLLKIVCHIF